MIGQTLVEKIAEDFGMDVWQLLTIVRSSPYRYKEFEVRKKDGGLRRIAQPSRETKRLQRWLVDEWLVNFPVHSSCTAYVKGKGIKDNASVHSSSSFLLKVDFRQFFPSIEPQDFFSHVKKHWPLPVAEQDLVAAANIVFWKPKSGGDFRLSIGGPASPVISNTILFDLDTKLNGRCENLDVIYTRYADDLTFSSNDKNSLLAVKSYLDTLLSEIEYPRLSLNDRKTVFVSKKHSRRVTGLVLSNDGKVSLGRERKRLIRAMLHRCSCGEFNETEKTQLRGLLAFASDVEPDFVDRMRAHYGKGLLEGLMRMPLDTGKKLHGDY
ncbi:MAG: retron St85 family RNA-directed DNA polymerase [Parvibaculum sp.]